MLQEGDRCGTLKETDKPTHCSEMSERCWNTGGCLNPTSGGGALEDTELRPER